MGNVALVVVVADAHAAIGYAERRRHGRKSNSENSDGVLRSQLLIGTQHNGLIDATMLMMMMTTQSTAMYKETMDFGFCDDFENNGHS